MHPNEAVSQIGRRRTPVMILGAHRSGTTATARALELCGLQIGQRLDSHHESKALQRLHENYLQRVGASWHHPKPFLDWVQTSDGERDCLEYLRDGIGREFALLFSYRKNPRGLWLLMRLKLGASWGWKEPRTTLFAQIWLQLFPNAHVLHVVRHPLAVATSIREREMSFRAAGNLATPQLDELDYCLRLALTYVESAEHIASQTSYYRRIRFEELQHDPRRMLEQLAAFCGLCPSRGDLTKAAGTIRPERSRQWNEVPEVEARELLNRYPMAAKLGYGMP
jgi:Sulfotransferase family